MKKRLSEKTKKIIIAAASMAIGVATIVIGNIIASSFGGWYGGGYNRYGADFYTDIYTAVGRVVANTYNIGHLISDVSRLAFIVTGCGFILHGVKILFLIGSARQGSDQCTRKKGEIDLDRLEKLKAAYDNGILNESEYYTEKSKTLNNM